MNYHRFTPADADRLARMTPDELREFLDKCGPRGVLMLDAAFELWANEGQLPPSAEGWRVWLMMAGRGFGKTRSGSEWINGLAQGSAKRIALVAASIDEARSIMVEGVSGILSVARRQRTRVKWEPSLGKLTWQKGTIAQLFSGDHADGLRGPEHHFAWCDELAKWRQAAEAWTNLQMGLRSGSRPRALVTTTPRPMRLLERLKADPWTVTTSGRTTDNVSLPKGFVDIMMATYGGTRIGRQELDGELIADVEGSLWPRELIERCRVEPMLPGRGCQTANPLHRSSSGLPPPMGEELDRVVVGVDPPAGSHGDACGIVVCARAGERFYVLADESVAGLSPDGWARAVAEAAARWGADRVVAEANNGGAMIDQVLRMADSGLKPKLVHASRGKVARAEPIAVLFEAGRAFFAGAFPQLEDELSGLQVGGGYEGPTRSPDRADACVWALSELAMKPVSEPRIRTL